MTFTVNSGIWPTMITLFNNENKIDYHAMKRLINWYAAKGVDGLFAVCQSSEMFHLSLNEKVTLAKYIKENASNMQVIASGHTSNNIEDQINEIREISSTGVDAFVLVSNRLAEEHETDEVVMKNVEQILTKVPNVKFGIYECPYPYKRLVSPSLLNWLSKTDRFYFLKDTSCDLDQIHQKVEAVKNTKLKIYNANSTTLLESLKFGVHGFSGVMANFQPELYSYLFQNWNRYDGKLINQLQSFLSIASLYELKSYPLNAKYFMKIEGIANSVHTRTTLNMELDEIQKMEIEHLRILTNFFSEKFSL